MFTNFTKNHNRQLQDLIQLKKVDKGPNFIFFMKTSTHLQTSECENVSSVKQLGFSYKDKTVKVNVRKKKADKVKMVAAAVRNDR